MGKKWTKACILLLLLLSALSFGGCRNEEEAESGNAVEVYYLNREETKIVPEVKYLEEGLTQEEQIQTLSGLLKEAPEDVSLKAIVGNSFEINSYKVEEGQLDLDVDEAYRRLPDTTEVLARAALVKTFTQIDGINHVLMSVGGESLTDGAGTVIGPMTADTFIDNAGEAINRSEVATLKLFFANEAGDRLVETSRTVEYNSNTSMERLIVEYIIKGPDTDQAYPVINPETKILGVTVKDGTCYETLREDFLTQVYNVTADVVIYSIINSLVELSSVNKVQISVNGKTDLIFRETFNLANMYERNLDLVGAPEETETGTQENEETAAEGET